MTSYKRGEDWWLYVYKKINTKYKPHYHENLCLCAIEKGEISYRFKDDHLTLKRGEIFIVNPFEIHQVVSFKNLSNYHILHIESDFYAKEPLLRDVKLYDMFLKADIASLKNILKNSLYKRDETDKKDLNRIKNYIDKNFTENLTLKDLAKIANLNESYLSRSFKKEYGLSPLRYIINKKVHYSKKLLDNNKNISNVALELGFFDQAHFYKAFKSIYLLTPKEYQKVKNLQD